MAITCSDSDSDHVTTRKDFEQLVKAQTDRIKRHGEDLHRETDRMKEMIHVAMHNDVDAMKELFAQHGDLSLTGREDDMTVNVECKRLTSDNTYFNT